MPSHKRPDDDLVPKGQPELLLETCQQLKLPTPNVLPEWDPLVIQNDLDYGEPNLPSSVNRRCPIELFKLFFTDEWLDIIVRCTNTNAANIQAQGKAKNHDFRYARSWHPITKYELIAYLAAAIHRGLHPEPKIKDYWRSYKTSGVWHRIRESISRNRWQQIDRFLYCEEPRDGMTRAFERVWSLSEHIQKISCKYWTPGKNLAVDESMQRFTGRAKEITTIPSKKHFTGYKIWILADHGYVLLIKFHAKGNGKDDGPYKLDQEWLEMGFSATEAVVLDLAISMDPTLLEPNKNIIWLDNLFTRVRLLEALRTVAIEAAGTARPPNNKTPREQRAEKSKKAKAIKKEKAAQKEAAKQEKAAKREAARQIRTKKGKASSNLPAAEPDPAPLIELNDLPDADFPKSETPATQPDFVPILELDELPDVNSTEKTEDIDDGDPEMNEPFNEELAMLRSHINQLKWGAKWFAVSKNKTVAQMAWRDNNIVLFATTTGDPTATVIRPRKRPSKSRTGAVKTR